MTQSSPRRRSPVRHARPLATIAMLLVAAVRATAQTPSPADGPWAGWVQCELSAQFSNPGQTYRHQQTHTWLLTSPTSVPGSTTAIKQYAATWQVTGEGTRQRGQSPVEQWTTAGQPMPDTVTIRVTAEGTVRIGGAAQLRSVGTTTGTSMPYVDEWPFPVIEGPATQTTIKGSAPSASLPNFPGAPPGTTSTASCSWDLVRGGGTPPSPPSPRGVREQLGVKGPGSAISSAPPAPSQPATPGLVLLPGSATAAPASDPPATLDPNGSASAPCTAAGPPVTFVATPATVHLSWARDPIYTAGVFSGPMPFFTNHPDADYRVLRSDRGTTPLGPTFRASGFGDPVSVTDTGTFDYRKTYVYTVNSRKYFYDSTPLGFTNFKENGCWVSRVSVTVPRAQTPVLGKVVTDKGAAVIDWKMPSDQEQSGFLVLGAGLPPDGQVVNQTRDPYNPCCSVRIADLPAGSQSWIIAPYWDTREGRSIDVSTGLRVSAMVAPWTNTGGPPPTGIHVQATAIPDELQNTCKVSVLVTWVAAPGATGYTVYDGSAAISPRMLATAFPYLYRPEGMKKTDPAENLVLQAVGDYANSPKFQRGVNIKVVASFPDRPDGASAFVPYTFSTYPCWDGRNFPSDP